MAENHVATTIAVAVITGALGFALGSIDCAHKTPQVVNQVAFQPQEVNQADLKPMDSAQLPITSSPRRGVTNPEAMIVVFTDFTNPQTQNFYQNLLKAAQTKFANKLAVVYKALPAEGNDDAEFSAKAAAAAHLQNKFWEMSEMLVGQPQVNESNIQQIAAQIHGLDAAKFMADLNSSEVKKMIDDDAALAKKLGVSAVPSIFINHTKVTLAPEKTEEAFLAGIQAEIDKINQVRNAPGGNYYISSLTAKPIAPVRAPNALRNRGQRLDRPTTPPTRRPGQRPPTTTNPADKVYVDISGAPVMGNVNAPVTLVEFTDFQCPFCSRAYKTLNELAQNNPDKIRIIFKHNPLPFHHKADAAHRAAEAAGMQGKFWEMYSKIFENQAHIDVPDLEHYAQELGLDLEKFKADMDSDIVKNRVQADISQAKSHNVTGTPSFFMNGSFIRGALPVDQFQSFLDAEIKIADKYIQRGVANDALYDTIIREEVAAGKNAPDSQEVPK